MVSECWDVGGKENPFFPNWDSESPFKLSLESHIEGG